MDGRLSPRIIGQNSKLGMDPTQAAQLDTLTQRFNTLAELGKWGWEVSAKYSDITFDKNNWPSDGDRNKVNILGAYFGQIHWVLSVAYSDLINDRKSLFVSGFGAITIGMSQIAYGLGIDLDKVVAEKMEKNRNRGKHHGGKLV